MNKQYYWQKIVKCADAPSTMTPTRVTTTDTGFGRSFLWLPLHDSQRKIEKECTPDHSVYKYHLSPTYDFKQELLRYGPDVEVLSPESFRDEMHADIKEMLSRYE